MGRKAFVADVAATAQQIIPGVSNIARGDEHGDVVFHFNPVGSETHSFKIFVTTQDVSEYPSGNMFSLFTDDSENTPEIVSDVLVRLNSSSIFLGKTISELIIHTAAELRKALESGTHGSPISLDEETMQENVVSDDDYDYNVLDDDDTWPDDFGSPELHNVPKNSGLSSETSAKINKRIRQDIRAVRDAGFHAGILHGMKANSQSSLVSISIRVRKLGLSDEAIQAWDLQKNQYVVLLIRYTLGYKTYNAVMSEAPSSNGLEFRVGVSNSRKPSVNNAMAAFTNGSKTTLKTEEAGSIIQQKPCNDDFDRLFISSSLNEFMNAQFTSLLKIRIKTASGWDGAKRYLQNTQGKASSSIDLSSGVSNLSDVHYAEPSSLQKGLPTVATSDHIDDTKGDQYSFPLIAMQFFMRYLTRCTEFCLVCHDPTEDKFEALKPYVCSKPLCLYQYMTLGFGPSVEHEILTQPYVVDLLISFCYAGAKSRRLREFPTGMSLMVPPINVLDNILPSQTFSSVASPSNLQSSQTLDFHRIRYDPVRHQVICNKDEKLELSRRSWVVLKMRSGVQQHHKVLEVNHPIILLSATSILRGRGAGIPQTPPIQDGHTNPATIGSVPSRNQTEDQSRLLPQTLDSVVEADLFIYEKNFDDLGRDLKEDVILMLLDTIPPVKEMRAYLKTELHGHSEPSLLKWNQRISTSALGLLRWIIASNRSCIVQIDEIPGDDDMVINSLRLDEKISGVGGWTQFRFAQGAPDKENRFQDALSATREFQNATYPTLFAWHGSSLGNWHSIIRSGLDFKDVINGRACGNGCYFSQDHLTSYTYCMNHYNYKPSLSWSGSDLKISSAMCLNEIVNAPSRYTHSNSHLVVQFVDWIQTRYLFVKTGADSFVDSKAAAPNSGDESSAVFYTSPRVEVEQDPAFTARGPTRLPIGIPRNAFPSSRQMPCRTHDVDLMTGSGILDGAMADEDQFVSDGDDLEDLTFLFSDDEPSAVGVRGNGKSRRQDGDDLMMLDSESPPRKRTKSMTDFVPGSLDKSHIKLMAPPSYATSSASRHLQRELKTILSTQVNTPLHELGWYIDQDLVENVYQWIVELHSFDQDLPLAKDMKNAGLTSVVLEIRFGKDYPISPPFLRVIRPRFLPFSMNGGGHVTAGGALCMELLTNSGWSAVSSIESVLLQVRMAISSIEPNPARLEAKKKEDQRAYGIQEAMDAFIRACRSHGWEVPKDFKDFGLP